MGKPTIFISHISEEREIAKAVKEFLDLKFLKGINVFASSHDESVPLGSEWINSIKMSMNECQLIIVICSPISIIKPWINFEAGAGWIKNIPVIPLCHSGLTPGKLPIPLNSFQGGLLNDKKTFENLFKIIANLSSMSTPDTNDLQFFELLSNFESKIQNTSLIKDTIFIQSLLDKNLEFLKYCMFASTHTYDEIAESNLSSTSILLHPFTFNDTYNLFNQNLILYAMRDKVYESYFKTAHELAENIKFALTYNYLSIAPSIRELLNSFLYNFTKVNLWYSGIVLIDRNEEIKVSLINMIKNEPLPPTLRNGNAINLIIDYYESLQFFQFWITEFEREIKSILEHSDN